MKYHEPDKTLSEQPLSEELEDRRKILDELNYREHRKARQRTIRRMLFVASITLILVGAFFWLQTILVSQWVLTHTFDETYPHDLRIASNVRLFGSFFILFSIAILSYLYMVGFDPRKQQSTSMGEAGASLSNDDSLTIIALLRSIDKSIEKGKLEGALSAEERQALISKISETVETQLNESLLSKIEEKYGMAIRNQTLSDLAKDSLHSTVARLKSYADRLQEKASVNLAWGIASTLTAILILAFVLINASPPPGASSIVIAFYYTSRLLLVLLVQGISVFFLNLYKSTLSNVMYLSNEITNYEARRDALTLSLNSGNIDCVQSILLSLAQTERNFALKKGETSIFSSMGSTQPEVHEPAAIIKELISKLIEPRRST